MKSNDKKNNLITNYDFITSKLDVLKIGKNWKSPKPVTVKRVFSLIGPSDKIGELLNKHPRTIRKWKTGTNQIDFANWFTVLILARLKVLSQINRETFIYVGINSEESKYENNFTKKLV